MTIAPLTLLAWQYESSNQQIYKFSEMTKNGLPQQQKCADFFVLQ